MTDSTYSLYLVRCNDGSLYTGIATDVERRVKEHEVSSKGAKYLRGKTPLTVVFTRELGNRSLASKVEGHVKKLSRREKSDTLILAARIDGFLETLAAPNKE